MRINDIFGVESFTTNFTSMLIFAALDGFNVLYKITFVHNSLVTDSTGRDMVVLNMLQKDITAFEILVTQWTLRVLFVNFQFTFCSE